MYQENAGMVIHIRSICGKVAYFKVYISVYVFTRIPCSSSFYLPFEFLGKTTPRKFLPNRIIFITGWSPSLVLSCLWQLSMRKLWWRLQLTQVFTLPRLNLEALGLSPYPSVGLEKVFYFSHSC